MSRVDAEMALSGKVSKGVMTAMTTIMTAVRTRVERPIAETVSSRSGSNVTMGTIIRQMSVGMTASERPAAMVFKARPCSR